MGRIDARRLPNQCAGVSLLEILVVLILVSVLLATISLNVVGKSASDAEATATRLRDQLIALNNEAILQGLLYAVVFGKDGYRFMTLNRDSELVPIKDDSLFREQTFPEGVTLSEFRISGAVLDDKQQILFDSTGLLPEFSLTLGSEGHWWTLTHTPGEGIRAEKKT